MNRNKNKSIVTLGIALVVLVGAALLLANPFKKPETDVSGAVSTGKGGSGAKVLVEAKQDAVTAISILSPGKTEFKLVKDGDKWKASEGTKQYAADQEKVDKILEAVPGLAGESEVSSNTEKYKDFGLDEATAIKVGVFTGGDQPAVTLYVGNSAPGAASSFVRVGEAKEVWRAGTNVRALVGFTFKDYRSKQPWPFDPQIVKSLTVRPVAGQADKYAFDNGVWKTASGANANQNLIVKLLEDWSKSRINEFSDDTTPGVTEAVAEAVPADEAVDKKVPATPAARKFKVGLEPNLLVETPQGTYSFTLGEKEGSMYYVADQDKLVYQMAEPGLVFFRELKFDELKIPAAEDAAKVGEAGAAGGPGAGETKGDAGTAPAEKPKPGGK